MESLEPRRLLAAGLLDSSFGDEGMVITDFSGNLYSARADTVRTMADGRAVVFGGVGPRFSHVPGPGERFIMRFNADGSFDKSFASGGVARFSVVNQSFGVGLQESSSTGDVLADGSIVRYGIAHALTGPSATGFAIARYTAAGMLSGSVAFTSFANLGIDASHVEARRLADGKFLLFAMQENSEIGFSDDAPVLVRVNADGTLDTTFAADGSFSPATPGNTRFRDIVQRPDGKVYLALQHSGGHGYLGITTIFRLNTDGTLDGTWGSGGRLDLTDDVPFEGPIAVAPDGGLYGVVERVPPSAPSDRTFRLLKLTAAGARDAAFGTNGLTAFPVEEPTAYSLLQLDLVVQPDGKPVVAASLGVDGEEYVDPTFIRFNTDGTVDRTFGRGGVMRVTTTTEYGTWVFDAALAANGSVIGVGSTTTGLTEDTDDDDVFVVRLQPDDAAPLSAPEVSLRAGMLTVLGTDAADTITLDTPPTLGPIPLLRVTVNGLVHSFHDADVETIYVNGHGGNDHIDGRNLAAFARENIAIPTTIDGGDGNDVIVGTQGRDRIRGEFGNDRIDGWSGNDWLSGLANLDRIHGGAGNDLIAGGVGADVLVGDDGADTINGGDQPDVIHGLGGNDSLFGEGGDDTIHAGLGADSLSGGIGNDTLFTRDGAIDTVIGSSGFDRAQVDDDDLVALIEQLLA